MKNLLALTTALILLAGCVSVASYEEIVAQLPAENFRTIDGQRVYFEQSGEGETVLLVHGFGASAFTWRDVVPELDSDFRVVAVDLSGFGFTERPREKGAYTRFAQGELLLGLMDELGVDRFHLVGHSYGGAVGAALAVRKPERFKSLTLLNAAGPIYPQLRRSPLAVVKPLVYAFVRTKSLRKSNIERALKRSLANDELATDELVAEYQRRLAIEGASRAFWGLTVPIEDPQDTVELAEVKVPTLALWGSEDKLIPVEFARDEASEIELHRFALIEGAGHVPMEERPHEVAEALRAFFKMGLDAFEKDAEPPFSTVLSQD